MIDLQKHIWEGWTVGDFVDCLASELNRIMSGRSWRRPFTTKQELASAALLLRSRSSPRGAGRISPITKSTFRELSPILPGGIVYVDSHRR